MKDQYKFQEMLFSIVEVAKIQENKLTIDEIKKFFGDINLTDNQFEHIFAYLTANHITVEGYMGHSNNEYAKVIKKEEEDREDLERKEEDPAEEDTIPTTHKEGKDVQITKEEAKDSMYLKMYLEDLSSIKELTDEEEERLLKEILEGNDFSKQRLIESKLSLVVNIAKEYKNQGMLIEDIIGEGNMGLIEGVNFLYEKSNEISLDEFLRTYIIKAIEDAEGEYADSSTLEKRIAERAKYINDSANDLKEDLGRNATFFELAEYTKLSIEEIKDILNMSGDSIKVEKHQH